MLQPGVERAARNPRKLNHLYQPFAQIIGILQLDGDMRIAIGGLVFLFEQIEGIS